MATTINDQMRQNLADAEISMAEWQRQLPGMPLAIINLTENKTRYILGEGLYHADEAEEAVRKFRRDNYEAMFDELEELIKQAAKKGKTEVDRYYEGDEYTEKFNMGTNILKAEHAFENQGYEFHFERIEIKNADDEITGYKGHILITWPPQWNIY